jgi:hypothetical protein
MGVEITTAQEYGDTIEDSSRMYTLSAQIIKIRTLMRREEIVHKILSPLQCQRRN